MSRRGGLTPDAEVATLRRYLKEIGRYPPLNHEQEIELATRIQAGDEDAVREMVESNLRFVVAYAKRYRNPNVPFLDLIHEGNLGLIQAAKKYDPSQEGQDVKFITYAVWWIRQAILHALAEHAGSFRLPQKQANTLYRMELFWPSVSAGRQPTMSCRRSWVSPSTMSRSSPGPRARRCRSTSRWIRKVTPSWATSWSRPDFPTPTSCFFGRAFHVPLATRSPSFRRGNARCSS
jgi:RNA polymerase sigma factor (sigma-70 family)